MLEVNLVADVLIAMLEGIKSKKQIKKYYDKYEEKFDDDIEKIGRQFDKVIETIAAIYPEGLSETEFSRPHLFYSLFNSITHCLYGLPGLSDTQFPLSISKDVETARNGLDRVGGIFEAGDLSKLSKEEQIFLQDCRRATTDETVRTRRTKYLLTLMT